MRENNEDDPNWGIIYVYMEMSQEDLCIAIMY
jgi:hypothetical protein